MSDDDGPDPNAIRRHQKKMLTEEQYRKKYRRIDYYRPNRKQLEFHNCHEPEVMLRAGNQEGKTHAAGAEMAIVACDLDFGWRTVPLRAPPKIERPYDFIGWAGCTTSTATRDGIQTKLLGDFTQDNGLGTGLIPLDNIVSTAMARGIADFVDTITLRREGGGTAVIRQKTFEMGRKAWQGEAVDKIWIDEDPGDLEVYSEAIARTTTTRGRIMVSMTPVIGATPVRKRFKTKHPGTNEILMTIDDCLVSVGGHIPDEDLPRLIAQYTDEERQTRLYGADMQGEGAVFSTPVSQIKFATDWRAFPETWPCMWGMDLRHSGSANTGHPFAAVLGIWDRDNDVIYIIHAVRMLGLAPMHVLAMKQHPLWEAPCAWPHDGGKGGSIVSGDTIAQVYKKLGLNMRSTHATFPKGGFGFNDGVDMMELRFARGGLKVAAHLTEFFDEYMGYHRKDGLVVKVDDDLLSATRQLCMDIRYAKVPSGMSFRDRPGAPARQARGVNFNPWTGESEGDE